MLSKSCFTYFSKHATHVNHALYARCKLFNIFYVSKYLSVYKLLDPSLPGLVLGSVLSAKTEDLAKSTLLDLLVKLVISNKIKTQPHVLRSLLPLFKTITHDEFKNSLLPTMSKAMLRNPELVMEAIR